MIYNLCPAYLPSIKYVSWIIKQKEVNFVISNKYQKQTYRNRAEIINPNGILKLIVPIIHKKNGIRQLDSEVCIDNKSHWQRDHWKSLETSYRSSPFFEFYEDELYPFFHIYEKKLMDLNIKLIKKILHMINAKVKIKVSDGIFGEKFELINAKKKRIKNPIYSQVFDSKLGFISDISVLDLIFNLGPESLDYLKKLTQ